MKSERISWMLVVLIEVY